ncbi:MAG TPA: substrate-binding domain-containing protein [Candidatus Barnesiella merdipullorum]|nr:substrate-binding domain-containing protein [Candidatus Barnesiella merdipullorum]
MRRLPNLILLIICSTFLLLTACNQEKKHFLIGVSQCSDDAWRTQMNKEIAREALFYPGVNVEFRAAHDDNQRQIADIEYFIDEGADLIVVAPNEAEAIAPIVEKAYNQGIPVVLVDRRIDSDHYTAYIGADNYDMGYQIGTYIAGRLHGKGNVVELTGLQGSTPARDRHRGLMDALADDPGIHIVATADAGWFQQSAEKAFDSILARHPRIDLVFAHNDRMASGAHEAAVREGRAHNMLFVGVDALSGQGQGVEMVTNSILDATFIYPTGGDRVMQVAMDILEGRDYPRETLLSTALVNHQNARIMQMQTSHISTLDEKIERLNSQLDSFLMRYSAQRMFLYACIVILVLVGILLVILVRAFWTKNRLNAELSSQKQQLEEQRDQLITLSRQLEDATHAKLAFFTNVSHDFRTPLTLIADPVDQLAQSRNLDKHERFLLNIIHKNVTVLLRLINQVLDFRKFEDGKLQLRLSQFDLRASLTEWTDAFRTLSYRKHIRFEIQADEKTDFTVTADAEKLERIVYNLLSNAFKFTPENGTIRVILTRYDQAGEPYLRLQVADTGVGMPAEHVRHIFDSFYQIDVHHAGSGIGLALVKAFVEMHHGKISVETTEGQGTCFTIEMPARQSGTLDPDTTRSAVLTNLKEGAVLAADQESLQASPHETNQNDKQSVLIIDDNQDIRDYVRSVLQDEYHIIEAANGQEGLQLAMKYVPDAIICDVMMPVMDGMECCRRLKSELQTSHIPVMMLTAYAIDEQKIKGYECGADSYISKPFSARLLTVRLHNLIDNRRRLQNFFTENVATPLSASKATVNEVDKGFAEKLRHLIDENLSNPNFSVEELGGQIGLSRVQLYRKTKALYGYSPNELLRIARLKRAAALLASTEKTVAEITYEVGFSSPSYFTKCYKEYFGENPTEFLKRKKGEN